MFSASLQSQPVWWAAPAMSHGFGIRGWSGARADRFLIVCSRGMRLAHTSRSDPKKTEFTEKAAVATMGVCGMGSSTLSKNRPCDDRLRRLSAGPRAVVICSSRRHALSAGALV